MLYSHILFSVILLLKLKILIELKKYWIKSYNLIIINIIMVLIINNNNNIKDEFLQFTSQRNIKKNLKILEDIQDKTI